MEVRSRFVIAVALVHVSHALVGFETVANSLLAFSVEVLTFFEALTDGSELLRRLIQRLLDLLVQLLLLHELLAGLDP